MMQIADLPNGYDFSDPRWKTLLRNYAGGIAWLDLFAVRTISFRLLYCLVILRQCDF
jgi:hypothetical protein